MSSYPQTLHALASESVSGASPAVQAEATDLSVSVDLTTLTGGTPLLDFEIEWSPDGTNFGSAETADTFTQLTAAAVVSKVFTIKAAYHRLVWTVGGNVQEIQAITHDHTGGNFNASFDGEGPTAALDWDAPLVSVNAEGTLTLDTEPSPGIQSEGTLTIGEPVSPGVKSQGTLTIAEPATPGVQAEGTLSIDEPVTDGDTFTIDEIVYRLKDDPEQAYDIEIGADEAATKNNIIAAIAASGTDGVEYFVGTLVHPTVTAAAFIGDDSVLTAITLGAAGNAIVTTETFDDDANIFDAATLGTTTTGVSYDTFTVDSKVYTLQTVLTDVDGNIAIGGSEAQTKLNIVAALDLSGVAGTDYATSMTAHPTVNIAAFATDDAILTAKAYGTAGDSIATTETFEAGTNVFDAATLGTTTAGADPDTFTIGTTVYRLMEIPEAAFDVAIGADEAASKVNIVAAVNLSGTEGVEYFAGTTIHPDVSAAAFATDDCVLTAKAYGTAGDAIATTETFDDVANDFDAATLGTTTSGVDADTMTVDGKVYTFQETLTNVDGNIAIGGSLAQAKLNLVAAFDLSGVAGTDYATLMTAHASVDIATFIADDAILTAQSDVAAVGNALATVETFAAGTNVFDAATLGTTTLGVNGIETELEKFVNMGDLAMVRNGDGDWDVTFPLLSGDVPLITLDDTNLTGGTTSDVAESVEGAVTVATFLAKSLVHARS